MRGELRDHPARAHGLGGSVKRAAYAVILAGGAGTRFWPASRAARPKQLLPLVSSDPMLVETARRVDAITGADHVMIATGAHLAEPTRALFHGMPREHVLIEPVPRNTAPCIGWAAARVARRDPEAVLIVLPSDHHIADVPRYHAVLREAIASAERGLITTIGIKPTHPETGYGYIELQGGADLSTPKAQRAIRFIEKPDKARAEELIAGGRHLWNAGMFIFRATDMLAAIRAHLPALARGLDAIDEGARRGDEDAVVAEVFPSMPSISIDHGVMDHVRELAVVPGDFGWSDVGSFQSAWELSAKDEHGNHGPEGAVFIGARGSHVVDLRSRKDHKVIAIVGADDLVVVETDDALLVVPRARAQDVKLVVDRLKASGRSSLT